MFMKKYFQYALAALLLAGGLRAKAQIAFTSGMTYSQNFDSYVGSAASLPAGWSATGSFTYRGQGNGTSNTGGAWAYGTGTERALGYLGSGSSPSIVYAVNFTNNTGSAITSLIISYDYEQWRFAGGNPNGWTVTGSGALAAVSLSGLNTSSTGSGTSGVVSVTPKSVTLTGLNIAPGAAFGIRWACGDGSGNDNGNGIDNFQMVRPCTPSAPVTIDTMLCAGSTYTWNGNTYTAAQNITDTFTNVSGCDSVVTLDLGFYPQITHSFADTICWNASYTWGAQTLTATGSYTQVFPAGSGCDSTVTLNLFERPVITHSFADTICWNDSYTWGAQTLTATGVYTQVFPAASGCDSTVTLNLFERPVITHSFADTICWNASYTWGAQILTATGVYTQVFPAASGCDSTVTLNLFERPVLTYSFSDTMCYGESYLWGTQTLTATGVYTQVFPSASGCDSMVTLNLFERPVVTHSLADTICWNDSYPWGTQTLTATGLYIQVFPAASGCDSTVTLNLFERPVITHSFADTICWNASYPWGTQTLTATGVYTQVFPAASGCDSTVTLNLFERPVITHSFADTICWNDSYTWGTQTLTATGLYTQVFPAASGCDSTVTLNLFERPVLTHSFADTICWNASYTWGTQTLTATGLYIQVFPAASGCDSTVTLNLFERPAIAHSFADTICWNDSYTWGTQTLTATGVYTQVFPAASGCDSTVTLNLFERPVLTHSFADTICWNGSYTWGTQTLTATGVYTQVFPAASGCDSTVTLNLFERPVITHSFADTICWNDSYPWGTQTLTATGVYTQVFPAASGCDSTVTLNLFERPAIAHSFADTICWNASYPWGTQTLIATGVYTQVFPSASGCDSTVTLNLFERSVVTHSVADTACAGLNYPWGMQNLTATGIYTQVFVAASGCDSTVTLDLYFAPVFTTNLAETICNGSSYVLGSQVLTTSGVYTAAFTSLHGCDSFVVLNLTVAPAITHTVSAAICNGAVYNWGSQVLNASGSYIDTFVSAAGCDSIVTLNLTVSPTITHNVAAVVCNGGTYAFGTQMLSSSGIYSQAFPAANGCDSTVTLNLTVSPVAVAQIMDTAGCGMVLFEGNSYVNSITLQDTLENSHGCDSVYRTIQVTVYDNTPAQLTVDASGCGSVSFEGNTYLQSTTLQDTYISIHGCDSLERTVNIRVEQQQSDTTAIGLCAGTGYNFHGTRYTSSGVYTAAYTGMHGCDSNFVLILEVHPLPDAGIELPVQTSFCIGDSIELNATEPYTYRWSTEWGADLGEGKEKRVVLPIPSSQFVAEATDDNGCRDTASITITAQPCCAVWMPNAFSPNGDGLNDKFKPEANGHPREYVMYIFDRWGAMVFSSFNIAEGWDGTVKGKPANIATYYYRISGKCVNGEPLDKRGELTLVR
jgi:gliding motility-associated-like protein